jgi:hypothetical protein
VALAVGAAAACALGGCASGRIESGVYHSSKGYRVALPGPEWTVRDGRADLELRHRASPAGILANASCDRRAPTPGLDALARHLLMGFRGRVTLERGDVEVNGRLAAHTVLDGQLGSRDAPMRVEAFVLTDARCVYDFAYAAPPATFETWRADFQRLVESFATE